MRTLRPISSIPTNNNTTPSSALFLNHYLGTDTFNQNRRMRYNAEFSTQGLQGFRVEAAEAFVDKQWFSGI